MDLGKHTHAQKKEGKKQKKKALTRQNSIPLKPTFFGETKYLYPEFAPTLLAFGLFVGAVPNKSPLV